jgi:hypothetical protein
MAAGSGLTAVADTSITNTLTGTTGGFASPTTNLYVGCATNNLTASTKSITTGVEWLVASDTAYVRQAMGANGAGWTIAAYVNGTGVVWKNVNTITQPAVAGAGQTLGAVFWNDGVGPTGGNFVYFADLASPVSVAIGISVVLAASSPGPAGITFTTY